MVNAVVPTNGQQRVTVIDDHEGAIAGFLGQTTGTSQAIQLAAAVLDKRISTARAFPRRISRFKQEAISLLQEDIETARSAEYAKPVGGSTVRGPSVRLAELAAMCWGNLDVEVCEPIVGEKSVTVMAYAWDLERNYRAPGMATASIIGRTGQRFANHMVETTAIATASKARRNAILAVIPKTYIADLLLAAKDVANKNKKPLDQTRAEMLEWFARAKKVTAEQIFVLLDVEGIDDINEDHIDELRAVATALGEGAMVEEFFPAQMESKTEALKAKMAARKQAAETPPDRRSIKPPEADTTHPVSDTHQAEHSASAASVPSDKEAAKIRKQIKSHVNWPRLPKDIYMEKFGKEDLVQLNVEELDIMLDHLDGMSK